MALIDQNYLRKPYGLNQEGTVTSESGASHYNECVTPTGTHRRPPAYTHTAKKVSQPSAMLRNSQVASSRREIPEITCFIVLFLFCKLSLASLLLSSSHSVVKQQVVIINLEEKYFKESK